MKSIAPKSKSQAMRRLLLDVKKIHDGGNYLSLNDGSPFTGILFMARIRRNLMQPTHFNLMAHKSVSGTDAIKRAKHLEAILGLPVMFCCAGKNISGKIEDGKTFSR